MPKLYVDMDEQSMAVSRCCALQHVLKCKMETKVFVYKWAFFSDSVTHRVDTFDKLPRVHQIIVHPPGCGR